MNFIETAITLIAFTLLVICFSSCSASRKWKKQIEGPIVFGSYGGFAGSFDEYTIHQDGRVFHQKRLKTDPVQIMEISEELRNEIFLRLVDEEMYGEAIDEPGNMTYFLKFTHKGQEYDLKWGGQHDPSQKLLEYHNYLGRHISAKAPTM